MGKIKIFDEIGPLVREALEKTRNGEPISDVEIEVAIRELEPVAALLVHLGDRYYLVWRDLHEALMKLRDYKEEREGP